MRPGVVGATMLAVALFAVSSSTRAADTVVFIDQGWNGDDLRNRFYFTPQGSRMVPVRWLKALERPDGGGMLADPASLARYGFIPPDGPHELNPDGLPIGIAVDPVELPDLGRMAGLTCAACHTANVTVGDRTVRIDGAPAHLDFDSFYTELAATLKRTLVDPGSFQRFAGRLLPTPSLTATASLRQQLTAFEAKLAGDAAIRHPARASGFGRVDALTQIVNALAVSDQRDPANLRLATAPTSYPQLWLAPRLEFVQWAPIAASPIGRNGGEVLGVFGSATLTGPSEGWYQSTILLQELHRLEQWVGLLEPPRWSDVTGLPIDRDLASAGRQLFKESCAGCHNMPADEAQGRLAYGQTDPRHNAFGRTFIRIGRVDYRAIGTDPTYVQALTERTVRTNDATAALFEGKPAIVPAAKYFSRLVGATVARKMAEAGVDLDLRMAMDGYRRRPALPGGTLEPYEPPSYHDLKAPLLAGAWATGPYLHNGSVATIDELLSPVSERRAVFWTGGRALDTDRLGYASDEAPGRFRFDTSLPGNGNMGHEVWRGTPFTAGQKRAIIEYIKAL